MVSDQTPALTLPNTGRPEKSLRFLGSLNPRPYQQPQDTVPNSDSDFSDAEGDLLPDEQEQGSSIFEEEDQAHLARLADWLDGQTRAESQVLPENSSSLPDNIGADSWVSRAEAYGEVTTVRKAKAPALDVYARPQLERSHRSEEEVPGRKHADTQQHRRGFSFIPGDDSRGPNSNPPRTTSLSANAVNAEKTRPCVLLDQPIMKPEGALSTSFQARPTATPLRSPAGEPQRDNSNRSVLTAIHNGSESPSPCPISASNSGSRQRIRASRQGSSDKKLSLAAAAARAAGKV